MMAASKTRTRGKGSVKTAAEAVAATASTAPKVPLKQDSSNPPKVFILPKDASPMARIVSLASPKTTLDTRYFCCPEKGFYEFTKVSEPRTTPRSWLLAPSESGAGDRKRPNDKALAQKDNGEYLPSQGYVTKNAELFIATPIDPLFLVLSALSPPPSTQGSQSTKRLFLASDDYLDNLVSTSPHFRTLLRADSTQKRIQARLAAVCDTVEAGDDTMYRLNETKLLQELLQKAKKMVEYGLPPSMEEKFVTKALEVPMLSLKREESSILDEVEEGEPLNTSSIATDSVDCQASTSSIDTLATPASFASTAATSISEADEAAELSVPTPAAAIISAPEGIPHLLRLRTALNFITSSYLPNHLQRTLQSLLQTPSPSTIDFTPLDQHFSYLADLRQQALASRSLGDYSRKRTLDEDEETRADKKRRKDEEDKKRKAGESRGVRELKKVNVKGMKKMSDFFAKKS